MSSRGAEPHDHEPARQPTLAAYAPEPVLPPAASAPDWRSRQGRWVDRSLSGRHHLPCCRGLFRPVAKSNPCTIPRTKRQRPSYRSRPHTPNLWTVPFGRGELRLEHHRQPCLEHHRQPFTSSPPRRLAIALVARASITSPISSTESVARAKSIARSVVHFA